MKKLLIMLWCLSLSAHADCNFLYPYGKTIAIANTTELCNSFYVSRYNEKRDAVIMVSEILQPSAGGPNRKDDRFQSDTRLKHPIPDSLYNNAGYDRGHLVPAEDSTTELEQKTTFLLSNAVPQVPRLNRGQWKRLENHARGIAKTSGPLYVITGVVYNDDSKLKGVIPIPTGLYKIIYAKSGTEYWYADNAANAVITRLDRQDLQRLVSYNIPK